MCTQLIKVKSKNPYQKSYAWVPCGKCDECRKSNQNQWTTRLKAEIEHYHTKKGYNIGFFTLTYNNEHLPYIPKKFFKDEEYTKIPCFSYKDIKKFTDTVRTHLWREYHINDGFRYFITSEYGEKFHRPHYHGIILFNNIINHKTMYEILEDAWTGSTNQIKNNKKRHTKRQNMGILAPFDTFIPRDNYSCGGYVAKYVCKDIEFQNVTDGMFTHLTKKMKNHLRHFQPFHKQSLAFGACILQDKSEDDLIKMLNEGISFTGNPKMAELPVYIKNKILFNTYKLYNLKTHKFESMKTYSKFFYENKNEIFLKKYNSNRKIISQYAEESYWQNYNLKNATIYDRYISCKNMIEYYDLDQLTYFYTLYFGVKYNNCYEYENPADGILARYNPCVEDHELWHIDADYYDEYTNALNWLSSVISFKDKKFRTEQDKKDAEIKAFWNNHK